MIFSYRRELQIRVEKLIVYRKRPVVTEDLPETAGFIEVLAGSSFWPVASSVRQSWRDPWGRD